MKSPLPSATAAHSPTRSDYIISLENITKRFPGVLALNNCSFNLLPGEVHALMGENGAGKSTLMKIMAGVYTKDSGEIYMDGKLIEIPTPRAAQTLGIGIIHQEFNLMKHLTAGQNIFIGHEPRSRYGLFLDEDTLNRKTKQIFEQMNLDLDPRTLVNELTIAKQQMVEIAKALSFSSRLLIMDEPTAALNHGEVKDLFCIIRQLQSKGIGIVYISHKMDELQQISNRITVMRDGQTIGTVPSATTSVDTIISMMVGRHLDHTRPEIADTSNNDVVLEVKGLQRGKWIKDVNFTLRKGEILGFAGLMGAGRTEVARAIFGADPIDAGEIFISGKKVQIKSPCDAVKHRIGYLSEDRKNFGLATGLDIQTNVAMSSLTRFLRGLFRLFLNQKEIRNTAEDFVQQLSIKTPSVEQPARLLSGGNQQKIVIAKWLLRNCDILFFDEPTRGIDIGAKVEIYKLLNVLAQEGKAIVMISSELPEILRMSHRILVMSEGRITGELTATEASQEKIMKLATKREMSQKAVTPTLPRLDHSPCA